MIKSLFYRSKKLAKKMIPNQILIQSLPIRYRTILFTFDDGPDPDKTPEILSILSHYNIKACFFCVGKYAEIHPNIVRRIAASGHIIGNHTHSHKNTFYKKYSEIYNDIAKCNLTLSYILKKKIYLFRPPRGQISLNNLIAARQLGLKTMLWSLGGGEWGRNVDRPTEYIVDQILLSLKYNDILLMHDNHPKIIDILNILMPKLDLLNLDYTKGFYHIKQYAMR